ncbi:starvation-inducible DNA-binding protein [Actinacidiphila yanglinensis]|uniref:Starvation-inducible DNA-binding protein n=1 Tax=Actinacidiphila yanglinensis TaxID=310779 RepID=A0A1H5ZCM0_9ACTN|nr:DNA starvation/stationary phase protection protein [Actinacidiphila yanglinensis]SEG33800.1 starvation-inducible DNA-binding protein [Actinacidiphila yanglinensis]
MTASAAPGSSRRSDEDLAGFTASPEFVAALQQIVVDLVELSLQGKQAHWNVVGHNFRDLHLQLDEVVDDVREATDTIAERMRAVKAVPDGRSDTVVAATTLPRYPEGEQSVAAVVDLITARLRAAADTVRTVHDRVDSEDPSTADLLHTIIDSLEKHAWMVGAENRSA